MILMSSINTYKFLFHFVFSLHLINIALQFVFKMSAFGFNISLKACTPLANGSIDDQLIKLLPGMNNSLTRFFNVSDLCPVNFILHYPPNLVINRSMHTIILTVLRGSDSKQFFIGKPDEIYHVSRISIEQFL